MIQAKTTPYLSAHPELLSLLTKEGPDRKSWISGEFGEFIVHDEGRVAWSSGELELSKLSGLITPFFFLRGSRPDIFLSYVRYRYGRPLRALVRVRRVRISTVSSGRASIAFPAFPARGPSPVRLARSRVSRLSSRTLVSRVGFQQSRPTRPNVSISELRTIIIEDDSHGITSGGTMSSLRFSRSWSGTRTPNFGSLKKRQLPVNPHSVVITDVGMDRLIEMEDWRAVPGANPGDPNNTFFFVQDSPFLYHYSAPADPSHLVEAVNAAISRLSARASGNILANLAQDLAQIGPTVGLITQNATKIAQSLTQLRRKNFSGAISTLFAGTNPRFRSRGGPSFTKSLANNWLQLQYGWKPLLSDIEGSMRAVSQLALSSQGFTQRVTASASKDQTTETTFSAWSPNSTARGVEIIFTTTRIKYGLSFKVASPLQSFLAQTGFTNPINLGWEILPFSFVVDWFVPIGPYLESLSAWDGLSFSDGWAVAFTRQEAVKTIDGGNQIPGAAAGAVRIDHGTYRRTKILFDRARITSFPRQSFDPTLRNGLASVQHAANAVALVKQVFGR